MGKLFSKSKSKTSKYERDGRAYAVSDNVVPQPTMQQYNPIHTEAVTCVASVRQGVTVSGSQDQTVAVFNYNSGESTTYFRGHEKEVTKVLYAPHIEAYFSSSRDKNILMWKDTSLSPVSSFSGHELVVTGISIKPDDNSVLCSGSRDNSLRLWDVATGQCVLHNTISRNLISHVKWAPSADLIAQSGEDKEVRIFDSRNLQVVRCFPKKQYIQTWCDISDDNNYCLSSSNGFGGQGCEATLWDIRNGQAVHEFKGHQETLCCSVFLPDSGGRHLVATSSNDCSVRVWDRDTRECMDSLSFPGSGPITSIAIQPDGNLVVSSFNSGIRVLKMCAGGQSGINLMELASY